MQDMQTECEGGRVEGSLQARNGRKHKIKCTLVVCLLWSELAAGARNLKAKHVAGDQFKMHQIGSSKVYSKGVNTKKNSHPP